MDNKTFKKMLLGMAMASPLALINSGNAHASSVKTNVETNWHANSLATVQQELRNQNINPDYKITNAKYIVQAGDTLSQIAAATHINMYHIAAVNHIQNLNLIYVGQVLILNQGNEVAHNVAGNGSTTAASIGNTYTLRSASQQPALNYYGHTQAQGTTGTPNVQRTANVNSQGTPAAKQPAKAIIPSAPSANNNNQNTKPTTPTGNTGANTGSHAGNTTPSVSGSVNTGSHVADNTSTNTGSTVTPNTQGSASQTGSSATQNNNSQKTPTVASSSASQQAPTQSSSAQQPASSASHATTPSASSNTQQPASSVSSASQPTGSSQAQGSVNTGSTATPSNSQKTPTVDSSSASQQTPTQSSSSQSGVSSSSQQTTASSSSSQQPASSASSSSQSTASTNSSSQSSASQQAPAQSSSSQSSASSSSQQPASSASSSSQSSTSSSASSSSQKTVDGYTLDNMPLSVFNDKKNLNAINNTFSGDAIENYFNNHIGKGNMTWDEAQQAQQNGQVTSAILAWNGQMLPTEMNPTNDSENTQLVNNEVLYSWRNALPTSYLNNDSQKAQINKKYGNTDSNDVENATQQQALNEYCLSLINKYRESQGLPDATTDSTISQATLNRANSYSASDLDHAGHPEGYSECLGGGINSQGASSMFDMMDSSYHAIYGMMFDDQASNNEHRNILLHSSKLAFATRKLSDGSTILIVEGQ